MIPLLTALARELQAFLTLLEEESAILERGDADALPPLTQQREQANRRIAGLWLDLARAAGLTRDASLTAMRQRVASSAPEVWEQVEILARLAEARNRQNSRMIDEQLRRAQAAAQVLRGAAERRALYGADGLASDFFIPHRSIDTA